MFEQKQTGKRKMELLPPKNFATWTFFFLFMKNKSLLT
jgi:hypothetical protein